MNGIKFTIALQRGTNKLVDITEVKNGKDCACYCAQCNEDLIAVNQEIKQRAHFRHSKESDCPFSQSYESYIHWLAKAVIKNLDSFWLPPIIFNDINSYTELQRQISNKVKRHLKTDGFQDNISEENLNFNDLLLQPATEINIQSCILEKNYSCKSGEIRVDAVLSVGNQELYIEPFYLHQIDANKLRVLTELGVTTLSIDLMKFVKENTFYFTKDVFIDYIKNKIDGKKWIFIRRNKAAKLNDSFFTPSILDKLSQIKQQISNNSSIRKKILGLHVERIKLDKQHLLNVKKLDDEMKKLEEGLKAISLTNLF